MSVNDFSLESYAANGKGPIAHRQDPGAMAFTAREVQEAQGAIIAAKLYPRDQKQAFAKIMAACERVSLAEVSMYAYKRGGQTISGPSIRLAEVLGQAWGNLDVGVRELSRDNSGPTGSSMCEAFCWDLETNVRKRVVFTVLHVRETQKETKPLTSERDIYELVMNLGSRRLRNCILATIPGDIVDAAKAKCAETMAKGGDIKTRGAKLVRAFAEINVTLAQIELRLGKKIDAMTDAEYVQFRNIYSSLNDGASEIGDWFDAIHMPEKINQSHQQPAPPPSPVTPAEKQADDTDRKLAIKEFDAAILSAPKGTIDIGKLLGGSYDTIVKLATPQIQARTDILRAAVAKAAKPKDPEPAPPADEPPPDAPAPAKSIAELKAQVISAMSGIVKNSASKMNEVYDYLGVKNGNFVHTANAEELRATLAKLAEFQVPAEATP